MNRLTVAASWLISLIAPFVILMLPVRLLLTPGFLEIEYRMPGFPADTYGFGLDERLRWARPSVEYLINSAEITHLSDLRFDDGQPIYNERELSHMLDVKLVVQALLRAWYLALGMIFALTFWAWRAKWISLYWAGWQRGGWLTIFLLVSIGLFASISFWQFFTWFHTLFFRGDSWLFLYSDTLIRLFPLRFWQDCVAYIAGLSLLLSLGLTFGLQPRRTGGG